MKITKDKQKIIKLISKEKKLGFVPTMGALHKGHISLIKKSTLQCNKTVVSIFINKPQFNKSSDFRKYPRSLKKDIEIIKKATISYQLNLLINHLCVAEVNTKMPIKEVIITNNACQIFSTPIKSSS